MPLQGANPTPSFGGFGLRGSRLQVMSVIWLTLQAYRKNGRPDHSLKALWRAYTASFLLNLPHTNALIRRLQDDPGLRDLCGFRDVLPHRTTFNRFIQHLSHHTDQVEAIFVSLTDRLKELLPELGEVVAIDSTAVRTHSNPNRKIISDPEARWGVKHSAKAKAGGTEFFFGYKSHAVADAVYGIPLAQVVTAGNRGDSPMLPQVMEKTGALYDWWKPKIAIGDRGYDSNANHNWLDERRIIPIIHIREPSNKKILRWHLHQRRHPNLPRRGTDGVRRDRPGNRAPPIHMR